MERVEVSLGSRSYEVIVGAGLLGRLGELIPSEGVEKVFVVTDRPVAEHYLEPALASVRETGLTAVHLGVPEGEEAKTLEVADVLYRQLATQEAHRSDLVLALGGGAVGDLAGFVASTYMRGLRIAQVPTTLTAQVDAAIGGKTAVNLPEGKNLVGAYHQPSIVLADVDTLATLDERDYRSGLGEVAKYAVTLDADLLTLLETQLDGVLSRDPAVLEPLVARCAAAKARTVASDERDEGARLILNYGHTLAHALERCEAYQGRSHGEAVAVGMVFAARLAEAMGLAADGLASQHARLLSSLGIETPGSLPGVTEILAAMQLDKKYQGGLRFVLLKDVGEPTVVDGVDPEQVAAVLTEMGAA